MRVDEVRLAILEIIVLVVSTVETADASDNVVLAMPKPKFDLAFPAIMLPS